jgi:predicted DNA-binding protein
MMKVRGIRLTEQLNRRLEIEAKRTGLRISEMIRRAIGDYLDEREQEAYGPNLLTHPLNRPANPRIKKRKGK